MRLINSTVRKATAKDTFQFRRMITGGYTIKGACAGGYTIKGACTGGYTIKGGCTGG